MESTRKQKMIAIIVASLVSLSGCASAEKQLETEETVDQTIEQLAEETGVSKAAIIAAINDAQEEVKTIEVITDEKSAVKYFEDQQTNVELATATLSKEQVEETVTKYLKNTVDFVFNNKEVNGVTFSELSNEAKVEIVESINTTNDILTNSGIKDITITAGAEAKVWTIGALKEATKISEIALKELMTEETYNNIVELKDKATTKVTNAYDAVKKYIKTQ